MSKIITIRTQTNEDKEKINSYFKSILADCEDYKNETIAISTETDCLFIALIGNNSKHDIKINLRNIAMSPVNPPISISFTMISDFKDENDELYMSQDISFGLEDESEVIIDPSYFIGFGVLNIDDISISLVETDGILRKRDWIINRKSNNESGKDEEK